MRIKEENLEMNWTKNLLTAKERLEKKTGSLIIYWTKNISN